MTQFFLSLLIAVFLTTPAFSSDVALITKLALPQPPSTNRS